MALTRGQREITYDFFFIGKEGRNSARLSTGLGSFFPFWFTRNKVHLRNMGQWVALSFTSRPCLEIEVVFFIVYLL